MKILYRLYKYVDREKIIVDMDVFICKDREHFKEHIRDLYGKDIKFSFSKNIKDGDFYCVIIGELWDDQDKKYFELKEFTCSICNCKVKTALNLSSYRISNYDIKYNLHISFNNNNFDINNYKHLLFCSNDCKKTFLENEKMKLQENLNDDELCSNLWITKGDFTDENTNGYIYKITKKSTKEFYIGKTDYLPIWRWGQHLTTDRFPVSSIEDYKFEVLEKVNKDFNLNEREKYYINKYQCDLMLNKLIYKV